jgi:hypothetical protein
VSKIKDERDRRVVVAVTVPLWLVNAMADDPRVKNRSQAVEAALIAHFGYEYPVWGDEVWDS